MFHPKIIFRIIGLLLFIEALFLSASVCVALYYDEPVLESLLVSIAVMVGSGGLPSWLQPAKQPAARQRTNRRESSFLVFFISVD